MHKPDKFLKRLFPPRGKCAQNSGYGFTLPSSEKLKRQQLELEEELASAKKEKQDLQKQQKTLQIIEHNFDAMIREAGIKVPEKNPSPKTQEDILS